MAANRNLFRVSRIVLLKLPRLFSFFALFRQKQRRLLIIKTDAIGDYILFRNFIEIVKKSALYKDYQIDLLGSSRWEAIALQYDFAFTDNFIFTIAEGLEYKPKEVLKLGWQLFCNNYSVVLQPTYSRTLITDGLAALTAAKQIIGFSSNTERIYPKYKRKTDKFYTLKLDLPAAVNFEFERTRFFFEQALNCNLTINSPFIPVNKKDGKGVVIFPGAGVVKRNWEAEKFLTLIKQIITEFNEPVYIVGGNTEKQVGAYLKENSFSEKVIDLTGKTSLPQLIDLIANAALLIGNETSATHIAVAVKTKSICIIGGGHFDRFAPYPDYVENKPLCIYQKMDCYFCNWNCIFKTTNNEPYPCISAIQPDSVWQATRLLLSQVSSL